MFSSSPTGYQLAFFTPGMLPAMAFTRNWYCKRLALAVVQAYRVFVGEAFNCRSWCKRSVTSAELPAQSRGAATYTTHPEVAHDTSSLASHYTPVLELGGAGVGVHLGELELGLGADTLG